MKTLFSILFLVITSLFVSAQESESTSTSSDPDSGVTAGDTQPGTDNASEGPHKYFIATNSGLLSTPIGFRIGIVDKVGGYFGTRFGKGYKYEEDVFNAMEATEATLFSASAGFIFPITARNTFKIHTLCGIGYGKWFDRPSKNGQTMGVEFEGGLMFSYQKFLLTAGGNVLMGDGNSPKGDVTLGVGFRF